MPASISFLNAQVSENAPAGTVVGLVEIVGGDPLEEFALSIDYQGRSNLELTKVSATQWHVVVKAGADLNYESEDGLFGYPIGFLALGSNGTEIMGDYEIAVTNVNEAPTSVSFTGGSHSENILPGSFLGFVYTSDPDDRDTFTYTLNDPSGLFRLIDNRLYLASNATLDYETAPQHKVKVIAKDAGGLTFEKELTINVTDVDEVVPPGSTLKGTSGNDTFSISASKSTLRTTERADTISGGAGNDTIKADGGNDVIDGGKGTDTIYGEAGDDVILISGSDGLKDKILAGETGESLGDTLELKSSKVYLAGFNAEKSQIENIKGNGYAIFGTDKADTFDFRGLHNVSKLRSVDAGKGNDKVYGSFLEDNLKGGDGNDLLVGSIGNDILSGGKGNDKFVFDADPIGAAKDRITDFGDKAGNEDVIDLSSMFRVSKGGFSAWKAEHVKQVGKDAVISYGDDQIVLSKVKVSALDYKDFDLWA